MGNKVYDLIGVGVGPFNLSLAALLEDQPEVDAVFFDQKPEFEWHKGMLIVGTRLQVPFMADFVTLADPTNRYSFLNYLSKKNRLYPFYFLQRLDIPRREYNDYCQWVADELHNCRFGKKVVEVDYDQNEKYYTVTIEDIATNERETYILVKTLYWVQEALLLFQSLFKACLKIKCSILLNFSRIKTAAVKRNRLRSLVQDRVLPKFSVNFKRKNGLPV